MKGTLRTLIAEALERARAAGDLAIAELPELHAEVPREAGHGDLASNVAMTLAKTARKKPRDIAEIILRNIQDPNGWIASAEVAGPGGTIPFPKRVIYFDYEGEVAIVIGKRGKNNLLCLDAETGKDLWHIQLGAPIQTAAMSYSFEGRQQITITAGGTIFTFALPQRATAPTGAVRRAAGR